MFWNIFTFVLFYKRLQKVISLDNDVEISQKSTGKYSSKSNINPENTYSCNKSTSSVNNKNKNKRNRGDDHEIVKSASMTPISNSPATPTDGADFSGDNDGIKLEMNIDINTGGSGSGIESDSEMNSNMANYKSEQNVQQQNKASYASEKKRNNSNKAQTSTGKRLRKLSIKLTVLAFVALVSTIIAALSTMMVDSVFGALIDATINLICVLLSLATFDKEYRIFCGCFDKYFTKRYG